LSTNDGGTANVATRPRVYFSAKSITLSRPSSKAPKRWPKYLAGTRRYVFPTFPLSFVYFEEQGEVFIVALAPESKRPGYWRERVR